MCPGKRGGVERTGIEARRGSVTATVQRDIAEDMLGRGEVRRLISVCRQGPKDLLIG